MALTATVRSDSDSLRQEILIDDRFTLVTDEPEDLGGTNTAPTPYQLVPAALASCVVTTLRMYARRKGWELGGLEVSVTLDSSARPRQRAHVDVRLPEGLSDEQRERLEHVAGACAVHRTLEKGVDFEHTLVAS